MIRMKFVYKYILCTQCTQLFCSEQRGYLGKYFQALMFKNSMSVALRAV